MSEDFWVEGNNSRGQKGRDLWIGANGMEASKKSEDSSIGLWSRSRTLRVVAWIVMIQGAIILSVFAATYLSGFSSVVEMISSLRIGLGV
jgi:hypothetical protein